MQGEYMDFQQSRTFANLQKAYEEELLSCAKHNIYAQQARQEGYIQIGNIFDISSHHEREHAIVFLKLMNNYEMPNTLTNLLSSAATERNEGNNLFREYAQIAREEGYDHIAILFDGIANIEINQEVIFNTFASLIQQDAVFCKDNERLWICSNCGNIMGGLCAPTICPICGYPQGYYQEYQPGSV